MSKPEGDRDFEHYRDFLMILARTKIPHHLRHRLDPAELVEETLRHERRAPMGGRPETDADQLPWLRNLLTCRLAEQLANLNGPGAGASLAADLDGSSTRLESFLSEGRPGAGARVPSHDLAAVLSGRLAHLTESQAEAVYLRYCEGWTVEQIGRHLGRTPVAVGGLLRHGSNKLADILRREPELS